MSDRTTVALAVDATTVSVGTDITVVVKSDATVIVGSSNAGPQGAPGTSGAYVHMQSAPALTWTVNHNLGVLPSVDVFDAGSRLVIAEVTHVTVNQTQIFFAVASAGFARFT